ncbi:MAG TPA: hypothetical protein VFF70_07380 [Anaerolineae bacterium]|nr:hypothetical protein [Anaerolineae bacterium]
MIPVSVFWRALKYLWDELFLLSVIGIMWMLFGLACIVMVPLTLGLSLLPLVPLTVGLFYVTNQVVRGNAIHFQMWFVGARKFLSRSLFWGAVAWSMSLLVWADLGYYGQISGDIGVAFVTLAVLLALTWIVWQILTLACLIEAGPLSLRAAYRTAWLLMLSQPLFVIALIVISGILVIICLYLPVLTGHAFGYVALTANAAVLWAAQKRSGTANRSREDDPRWQ